MDRRLYEAFDAVKADETLRMDTKRLLNRKCMESRTRRPMILRAAAAACCMVLLLGFGGFSVWAQPVSYISVDSTSSVELAVNRFGRVVDATGYGPDGQAAVETADPKNQNYTDAVSLLLSSGVAEDGMVSFTVQTADEARQETMLQELQACASGQLGQGIRVECHAVNESLREQAAALGLSPGKYRAILELQEVDPEATVEEYRHCSMQELRDCEQRCLRNSQSGQGGQYGQGGQGSPGQGWQGGQGGGHGGHGHHQNG